MIKSVIFDFDGTLMNTLPCISHCGNAALKVLDFEPIETDDYKYIAGNGKDMIIHRILKRYNADTPENFLKASKKYDEEYNKDVLYQSVIYDGIPQLLSDIKKDNIKLCVLSNKPHDVTTQIIQKVFGDIFDIYYGQRAGIPAKPSPEGALEIADCLNLKPEECAFVGDTIVDITTGKNAGMHTISVLWGFRKIDELKSADFIVKTPEEIYNVIKKIK